MNIKFRDSFNKSSEVMIPHGLTPSSKLMNTMTVGHCGSREVFLYEFSI